MDRLTDVKFRGRDDLIDAVEAICDDLGLAEHESRIVEFVLASVAPRLRYKQAGPIKPSEARVVAMIRAAQGLWVSRVVLQDIGTKARTTCGVPIMVYKARQAVPALRTAIQSHFARGYRWLST